MAVTQLPYQPDSALLFEKWADQPYALFLDSCGSDRFDIIAAHPSQVVIAKNDEDPFDRVKQILSQQPPLDCSDIPDELPFTVGAIGYFSYDLGYRLMDLPFRPACDIALPAAVIGFYDWSIVVDHLAQATYLISRDNKEPSLRAPAKQSSSHFDQNSVLDCFAGARNDRKQPFSLTSPFLPNMNKIQYAHAFEQVKKHIYAGDCYQVNLAQRFSATYCGSPWSAYRQLRKQNPMPMAAYLHLPEGAALCLSPERFLQVDKGCVATKPIKGTRPRFKNPEQDQQSAAELLSSEKDHAENKMIVDLLRNDLGKCCRPGSIKAPQVCALESFPAVHHLVSTVTGVLEPDCHPLDLLRHCFPGGSITGAPKRRAMEIIHALEPNHRSLYCGSVAYCDVRGRMDSNIMIRTLLCSDQKIYCYGGGGVVNDSTLESEYQEIQVKISRLLDSLETHY